MLNPPAATPIDDLAVPAKPYSPETLAARWECSAEKIRQMYHRGELVGFRLGKLIRFTAIEVERFECANLRPVQNTRSSLTEENTPSRSARDQTVVDIRLARMTRA
jgi:hypothetical protein